MIIFAINCGSSSLKFKLLDTKKTNFLAKGLVDEIGLKTCEFTFESTKKNLKQKIKIKNHHEALELVISTLIKSNAIKNLKDIQAISHRIVHGGEKYLKPTLVDNTVIKEIKKLSSLAPLHNPANVEGILACKKAFPSLPHVAIFDTSFHQTMPEKAYLYGIPYDLYKKYKIRKYGFHGTSHNFVINKALKLLKNPSAKIISCHLGNGSSITAFNGKSIDTSMGFSPMEGVMMGTRAGSIDSSIIFYLHETLKYKIEEINKLLNYDSGLKGLSGISQDMRKIYQASLKKNKMAILTIETLSYQIAKYCGAYMAALNGVDAIIFTGGLGEKAFYVREKICNHFKFLGLKLNQKNNKDCKEVISDKKSKIKVFVIETDEGLQMAKETEQFLNKK